MTHVYFVRHAEADCSAPDDTTRPLTEKGLRDSLLVTEYLADKKIAALFSSPYKRAVQTMQDFAHHAGLVITLMDAFAERRVAEKRIDDYDGFAETQWDDFGYSLPGGESLREVQARNVHALNGVLSAYKNQNIAVCTHGTALATVMARYDRSFGHENFMAMKDLTPWVVHFTFIGTRCRRIETVKLLAEGQEEAPLQEPG